jgi:hypothetical protein
MELLCLAMQRRRGLKQSRERLVDLLIFLLL